MFYLPGGERGREDRTITIIMIMIAVILPILIGTNNVYIYIYIHIVYMFLMCIYIYIYICIHTYQEVSEDGMTVGLEPFVEAPRAKIGESNRDLIKLLEVSRGDRVTGRKSQGETESRGDRVKGSPQRDPSPRSQIKYI